MVKMNEEKKFQISASLIQLIVIVLVNAISVSFTIATMKANTEQLKQDNADLKVQLEQMRLHQETADKSTADLKGEVIELKTTLRFYIDNKVK